jgi:hypothetical protein
VWFFAVKLGSALDKNKDFTEPGNARNSRRDGP